MVAPFILWMDRRIPVSSKQLTRRVLAHLVPSLLVTSVYVLCFRSCSRHVRDWRLEGLAEYRVSEQYAARHVPVKLAHPLADFGSLEGISKASST
jgi:hypothetical protein